MVKRVRDRVDRKHQEQAEREAARLQAMQRRRKSFKRKSPDGADVLAEWDRARR